MSYLQSHPSYCSNDITIFPGTCKLETHFGRTSGYCKDASPKDAFPWLEQRHQTSLDAFAMQGGTQAPRMARGTSRPSVLLTALSDFTSLKLWASKEREREKGAVCESLCYKEPEGKSAWGKKSASRALLNSTSKDNKEKAKPVSLFSSWSTYRKQTQAEILTRVGTFLRSPREQSLPNHIKTEIIFWSFLQNHNRNATDMIALPFKG